jgi:hypothetical protein
VDRERALNLTAAAELAGLSVRELRRHLKEGHLPSTAGPDGKPRVTAGDLAEAGLIPHELAAEGIADGQVAEVGGNGNGRGALQAWSALGDPADILQRLLLEREQAASAWKERTESLYRELVEEQRERIERLEDEKRGLTDKLHEALRQVPKLLELEKVEAGAREAEAEADRLREESAAARTRVLELDRTVERLEAELSRSSERCDELDATLRRLRARGLWSRLVDREPHPEA